MDGVIMISNGYPVRYTSCRIERFTLYIVITGEEIKRIGGLPLDRFFLDLLESESSGPQWRPLI